MKRPEKSEYAEFYETYISLVEEFDIVSVMQKQLEEVNDLFSDITDEKGVHTYQEGKWTIKELLGHLIDGERIFAYRAFRFSRADKTQLPGFDQNPYIENANYNLVKIADLLAEFSLLRQSNIFFFRNLSEEMWSRTGIASDNPISVRALAFVMVGHVRHHIKILKERYLAG
jgi:DinB superfamily